MEVIIADGKSTDHTLEEIAIFRKDHPDLLVKIVDNPQRVIPAGLNRAIQNARGEIIVRLDGHSMPKPDYVARCVDALNQGCGDNVGGVWEIRSRDNSWQARSIATAAAHPLGVGDAYYRVGGQPQEVDTVPFGAFKKTLFDRVGLFNEALLTNEDYEFNTRVRQAGGIIWMDPKIITVYFPSKSIVELVRQYWRYGFWKGRMLQRYPGSIRWRQALPPAFIISLVFFGLLGIWLPIARWVLSIQLGIYILILFVASLQVCIKKRDVGLFLGLPLAIATMHIMWGTAFLWSLVRQKK